MKETGQKEDAVDTEPCLPVEPLNLGVRRACLGGTIFVFPSAWLTFPASARALRQRKVSYAPTAKAGSAAATAAAAAAAAAASPVAMGVRAPPLSLVAAPRRAGCPLQDAGAALRAMQLLTQSRLRAPSSASALPPAGAG